MVILMPPIDQTYLWNTEYKIYAEGNFKCCCLLKPDSWTSCNFVWRPRPNRNRKLSGRSSSVRLIMRRSAAHISRTSMLDTCFPLLSTISARSRDEDKIVGCSSNLVAKQFMDDPVEEPWLRESSLDDLHGLTAEDKIVRLLGSDLVKSKSLIQSKLEDESEHRTISSTDMSTYQHQYLYENDQPVEEPWLLGSSLSFSITGIDFNEESVEHEAKTDEHFYEDHQQIPDKFFPDVKEKTVKSSSKSLNPTSWSETHSEGSMSDVDEEVSVPDSVTTVILINSSLCTMQRIAVLEDGKLVELLLEPVKNNVQCDSVYLGTVTKLVPNMSGAFVNIGIAKNSLMEIKSNKKPFIFPPFCRGKKGREVNGNVVDELSEILGSVAVVDDIKEHKINFDTEQYAHDDFDEHDIEDDVDVAEVSKENFDGDVELDGDSHAVSKVPPFDLGYHGSNPSILEIVKECKETWAQVQKGTKVIVQVVKEGLGTKGPALTAYPKLRSRFWAGGKVQKLRKQGILMTRNNKIGISKKISGLERTRLKVIAKTLLPPGYGLIVRSVAVGHSLEELKKDLDGLLSTWKSIVENAKSAALAADEGVEGAIPVMLHRAMGQTLSVVQDYFNEKVKSMVVDSPRTYHEVTHYLQKIAPDLCDRVELYTKRTPLFDEYNLEEDLNNILSKRVSLSNGGYLVIEQTEALVSIDVNGGHCMLGHGTSQNEAVLEVNLAAAKQIAMELRLRDIGGIIVVDFIDMPSESNRRLVYEEVKKAVERDRSTLKVSELSRNGLMEITRQRVRPSVTFMVTEPCTCCYATGRVEASETLFSRIEHEICRLLAKMDHRADPGKPKSWPRFILKVDQHMSNYLTSGRRTKLALLSSSLKVWILLKVARGFTRGVFELKPLADEKEYKNHQAAIAMINKTSEVGMYMNTPRQKFSILPSKWNSGRNR